MVDEKSFENGRRVKTSNLHHNLADPKVTKHRKHDMQTQYRIFGDSGLIYEIPKTSTQELLESRKNAKSCSHGVVRYLVNFVSYPMNDFRFVDANMRLLRETKVPYPPETTYVEKFKPPFESVKEKDCCDKVLDPLFNRIPKNDFEMLPTSTNKFMDDHLVMLSEGRKRINCLRQLRNASSPIH